LEHESDKTRRFILKNKQTDKQTKNFMGSGYYVNRLEMDLQWKQVDRLRALLQWFWLEMGVIVAVIGAVHCIFLPLLFLGMQWDFIPQFFFQV